MTPPDSLTAYRQLVEIAETQCALVQAGHLDELPTIQAEWDAVASALPAAPPAAAEPLLRRAVALVGQAETGLKAFGADLQRQMGKVGESRAVGRAYAPAGYGAPRAGSIDTAA